MKRTSLSDKLNRLNNEPVPGEKKKNRQKERIPLNREPEKETQIEIKPKTIPVQRKPVPEPVLEEEQEERLLEKTFAEERKKARNEKIYNALHGILILACVYAAFLVYGAVVTTYEYDISGRTVAQRMTVSDITAKNEYEKIYFYYEACRGLYESTLLLDYRLGAGVEEPLMIAPEYESLLDTVENLSIKTDALNVDTGYSRIKSMMLTWIQSDIAVYLQNMSSAISQNDTASANNALQDRDRVYNDFMLITQNMAVVGESIKGVDLHSIRHWTPENYIDEEINGETS